MLVYLSEEWQPIQRMELIENYKLYRFFNKLGLKFYEKCQIGSYLVCRHFFSSSNLVLNHIFFKVWRNEVYGVWILVPVNYDIYQLSYTYKTFVDILKVLF